MALDFEVEGRDLAPQPWLLGAPVLVDYNVGIGSFVKVTVEGTTSVLEDGV